MEKREIHNAYAELEGYNCFACSPTNPYGLKCKFVDEGDCVSCHWMPNEHYQGFFNVLHGGIQATLIDEIASWVIFTRLNTAGMTVEMNVKYRKTVHSNKGEIVLKAKLESAFSRLATAKVELFNADGELATEAEVVYRIFPEKLAREKLCWPGVEAFYKK